MYAQKGNAWHLQIDFQREPAAYYHFQTSCSYNLEDIYGFINEIVNTGVTSLIYKRSRKGLRLL